MVASDRLLDFSNIEADVIGGLMCVLVVDAVVGVSVGHGVEVVVGW